MPIFTSKFSPNRSLIGNFLASVARKKDEVKSEQEKARTDSTQPSQDRLELTGQVSAAQQALANSPSAARLQTSATPHIPPPTTRPISGAHGNACGSRFTAPGTGQSC